MPFLRFLLDNASYLSVGFLLTFASSFGQTFFISIFAGKIQAEFGLSHGEWGAIYAGATLGAAAVMIWAGGLTDVFRVRVLAAVVLAGLALACLGMAGLTSAWMLVPVVFLLRLCGQGMSSHVGTVAMARWFIATRGRALSVASMGFAAGEAVLPLAFVALLAAVDWRSLWVGAAAIVLALLPAIVRLLRQERTPQADSAAGVAAGMGGLHWTRRAVLRHWLFWIVAAAAAGLSAFNTAFFFHQVHIAEAKGWTHLELVALYPIYTAASVAAMLGSGWLIDRFGSGRLMAMSQAPIAAGFLLFGLSETPAAGAGAVVLIALTQGATATLGGALWAEYFGTRHLGAIRALAMAVMVSGSALGPGLTGALIDAGVAFPDQMVALSAWFLAVTVVLTAGLRRASHCLARTPEIDVVGP